MFPGGLAVLAVAPVSSTGPVSSVGNTALAVLWLATGVAGYRAARTRRYGDHRRWMLRSVALTFSIVPTGSGSSPTSCCSARSSATTRRHWAVAAAGASVWSSWVVNLLVVEWWVLRPPGRRRHRAV